MNTKKLLLTAGLVALAGAAQAVPNDTSKASLLVFPDIEVPEGRTTLVQISNFGSSEVHIQCFYQTADKVKSNFSFDMSGKETRVFDAKTGAGVPGNTSSAAFPNGPYTEGMLICLAVAPTDIDADGNDDVYGPVDVDGTGTQPTGLTGVARVVQYYIPGWVTEYQAWTMTYNTGGLVAYNDDLSANLTFGPAPNTYEACARTMIGNILTRNSYGATRNGVVYAPYPGDNDPDSWVVGDDSVLPLDAGTMVVDANHLFVVICAQQLNESGKLLYTKLNFSGWDEDENDFTTWQCGDSWYDVNLGDPNAPDPWWGGRQSNWSNWLNIQERWAVQYQVNVAPRSDATSTCGCGGVKPCPQVPCSATGSGFAPYNIGCPADGIPPYNQHPGATGNVSVGLWATQRSEFFLMPADDQDAASSNLFAWRNAQVNGYIRVDLTAAAK